MDSFEFDQFFTSLRVGRSGDCHHFSVGMCSISIWCPIRAVAEIYRVVPRRIPRSVCRGGRILMVVRLSQATSRPAVLVSILLFLIGGFFTTPNSTSPTRFSPISTAMVETQRSEQTDWTR